VHDLRVAIRRLNTVFDLIDRFNPDNMVRRSRDKLKAQLSALSFLRDAHVEMVRMRGLLKQFPEMKPLYEELVEKEADQLKSAKKIGWKADRKFIDASYNRAMLRLNARRATSAGDSTRKIIDASIDVLFDNLSRKLAKVTATNYASIHRVRLAFRPLRYTLELLQPLLGLDRKQLRTAANLARLMGHIQDLEVLMRDLIEFNWGKEKVLAPVVEVWLGVERSKIEQTQRFMRALPKFGQIWRPIIHDQAQPASGRPVSLFVLRHGIAVQRGDSNYPLDSDRPLTAKGVKRMRKIAYGMRRLRVGFDVVLSSPYRRALETAFVVAREYQAGETVQTASALKAEVLPEEVIRTLLENFSTCRRMLLVGHEPQLSALVSTLTSGSAGARPLLKKGGLCKVQVDKLEIGKCATLVWLLTPKQLMTLG
jgi:phosphohistidine phosphatase